MQFLGKIDKFVCWRPPGELAPPPRGNPGSATASMLLQRWHGTWSSDSFALWPYNTYQFRPTVSLEDLCELVVGLLACRFLS